MPTTSLTIEAFAKVNLTLEVYGTRPDGFHALSSLVQPISLADTLVFEPAREGENACTTDTGYGDKDLIVKASTVLASAALGYDETVDGRDLPAYHVRVTKRIPVGGGLGGGSADAAAALRALNGLWNLRLTPEELSALGADVGSDVPALVLAQHYRRCVLMEGRGEVVSLADEARCPIGSPMLPTPWLVLANPDIVCSTPAVFSRCTARTIPAEGPINDLASPAIALHPEIGAALAALRAVGLEGVRMSGSGATVFGFADSAAEAEARAATLRASGLSAWHASALSEAVSADCAIIS